MRRPPLLLSSPLLQNTRICGRVQKTRAPRAISQAAVEIQVTKLVPREQTVPKGPAFKAFKARGVGERGGEGEGCVLWHAHSCVCEATTQRMVFSARIFASWNPRMS